MSRYSHGLAKGLTRNPEPGLKLCVLCLEPWPLMFFAKAKHLPDGLDNRCNACRWQRMRKNTERKKPGRPNR